MFALNCGFSKPPVILQGFMPATRQAAYQPPNNQGQALSKRPATKPAPHPTSAKAFCDKSDT
jgi:hypothetical protein